MIEHDTVSMNKDKTVTISIFSYNCLMYDSFKLSSVEDLCDVTKEKLDKMYNLIINNYRFIGDLREKVKNIYYGINEEKEEEDE